MQAEYPNGVFGPVEEFDTEKLKKLIDGGAEQVSVFKTDSPAHNQAKKNYSEMTHNQKKRFRKQNR